MGGTLAAIERGFQQREIQEAAYRVQLAIDTGDQVVVGVNRFTDDEPATPPTTGSIRRGSGDRSTACGRSGPSARPRVGRRHGRAGAGRRRDGNLMPAILEAVRAYATVGEISDRLRVAWGEHRELITV